MASVSGAPAIWPAREATFQHSFQLNQNRWPSFRKADRGDATDGKLACMDAERRSVTGDRRARRRGGRRDGDTGKPWYMRRRLWLAAASILYVGWRRVRRLGSTGTRRTPGADSDMAA
jgi:hypothetical protein